MKKLILIPTSLIAAWLFVEYKPILLGWIPPMVLGFIVAALIVVVLSIVFIKLFNFVSQRVRK